MIATAARATFWWPKKFSSKLARRSASRLGPSAPVQAAAGIGHQDVEAAVSADRCRPRPSATSAGSRDIAAQSQAPHRFRSRPGRFLAFQDHDLGARGGEGAGDRRADAPPPPVMTATWPPRRFAADLPSLACSSDQYSMSKIWASVMLV